MDVLFDETSSPSSQTSSILPSSFASPTVNFPSASIPLVSASTTAPNITNVVDHVLPYVGFDASFQELGAQTTTLSSHSPITL